VADQAITASSAAPSANSTDYIPGVQGSTERVYFTPSVLRDFHFANPSTLGGDLSFGMNKATQVLGNVTVSTGTGAFNIETSDSGQILVMASSSTTQQLVTRSTLPGGFAITILQETTGEVAVSASVASLRHPSSHSIAAGQYSITSIVVRSTTEHYFGGDTSS
jgi:hypothetical protein